MSGDVHLGDLFIKDVCPSPEEVVYDPTYGAFITRYHPCREDDCIALPYFDILVLISCNP